MSSHPFASSRRTPPIRPRRGTRRLAAILLVPLVASLLGCGPGGEDTATESRPARPEFPGSLAGLDGGKVALSKDGTPSVIAFVANWCAPCRLELPELERLHQKEQSELTIVAVGVQEEPDQTRQLVSDTGITFPVAVDPDGEALAIAGIPGLPGMVILDGEGRVAKRLAGRQTAASVSEALAKVR